MILAAGCSSKGLTGRDKPCPYGTRFGILLGAIMGLQGRGKP